MIGCKNTKVPNTDNSVLISIRGNQEQEYIGAINEIELIPLQRSDELLSMNKPTMLFIDSCIVFVDCESGAFIGYNKDYSLRFSHTKKGRGPGEYIELGNAYSYRNIIYAYDCSATKIIAYDDKGAYIDSYKMNGDSVYADYLFQLNTDTYVGIISDAYTYTPLVRFYDKSQSVMCSYLDLSAEELTINGLPIIYKYADKYNFIIPFKYNLYSIDSCSVASRYQFIFDGMFDDSDMEAIKKMDYRDRLMYRLSTKKASSFSQLFEVERYISFKYTEGGIQRSVLIDKHKETSYSIDNVINKDIINDFISCSTICGSDDIYLYGYIRQVNLSQMQSLYDEYGILSELFEQFGMYSIDTSLDENDNIYFRMKLQ